MRVSRVSSIAFVALWALLSGCRPTPTPIATEPASEEAISPSVDKSGDADSITLPPNQIAKLGIVSSPVRSTRYLPEASGVGVIENHDTIAQAAADVGMARATLRVSHQALRRAQTLAGTPGAVSADVEESAAQKEQIDSMALRLTTQKLSSTFGRNPPWQPGARDGILTALANGEIKLVRATFPLGRLAGGTPRALRAERLVPDRPGAGWKLTRVWDAPAAVGIPGRSFFALLEGSDGAEGERLQVYAPVRATEPEAGVMIPGAAAVMSDGKYWCYVEPKPGTFVRTEINADRPTPDGYFMTEGINAGARIVTASAGQLLALELRSSGKSD